MILNHKKISAIPFYIVMYWLFCALFLNETRLYWNWFAFLDIIDSVAVGSSTFHYIFYRKYYSKFYTTYIICVYFIVLLNFLYFCISTEFYYFLYYSIILTFTLASFWKYRTHNF